MPSNAPIMGGSSLSQVTQRATSTTATSYFNLALHLPAADHAYANRYPVECPETIQNFKVHHHNHSS